VAWLYKNRLPEEGAPARARALADLADTYGEGSPWWEANRSNPEALAAARQYIQQSLSEVAQELHRSASEKEKLEGRTAGVKMAYSEAADRYRNYLESDPFVSDQEKNQWYLAGTLFSAGRYKEAIAEYTSLAAKVGHPYKDGSRYSIMLSWQQILINTYGKDNIRASDAIRERVVVASDGKERSVYALAGAHNSYIAAADDIRSDTFEDIPENAAYIASLDENRVALHYTPAQLLYEYGRYEDARPRLEEVIDLFPRRVEAGDAANLLVNTFLGPDGKGFKEGDLESARTLLARFSEEDLGGDPAAISERQRKFRRQFEQTTYNLAYALKEDGKPIPTAKAFLAFTEEFPESEDALNALYSAAVYYKKAGKFTRANELNEQFINLYPDDKKSEGLTFDIAMDSADVLDFEKALEYYGRILRYFGEGEYADSALINSAQLKVGQGDHRGAATALEDYVKRFPEDEANEDYLWLASQQWELEGDRDALRFFQRYLDKRRGVHPGHTLEALHWIADHYEQGGNRKNRKAPAAWLELVDTCNRFLAEGQKPGRRGLHLAASVLLRELLSDLERFQDITYPDPSKISFVQGFNELKISKKEELDGLADRAIAIFQTYADPVTTMGAFYLVGAARLAYAELFYNAPTPTFLNERQAGDFRKGMRLGAEPEEEKAIGALKSVLEWSEKLKENSEWVDKAIVMLNALRPKEYPLEKTEIRGVGDSTYVPVAGPRSEPLSEGGE
jgi:TolA-binding protein